MKSVLRKSHLSLPFAFTALALLLCGCSQSVEFSDTKKHSPASQSKSTPESSQQAQTTPPTKSTPTTATTAQTQTPKQPQKTELSPSTFPPPEALPKTAPALVCDGLANYTKPLKFVFMVDDSSSTLKRKSSPGTDPEFTFRRDATVNFIKRYADKKNFTYAFGYFSGKTSRFYNFDEADSWRNGETYFGDAQETVAVVQKYVESVKHGGNTPIKSAMTQIDKLVDDDRRPPESDDTQYVIIIETDGAATDLNTKRLDQRSINREFGHLVSDVVSDAGLHGRKVEFNALYFGPQTGIVDVDLKYTAEEVITNLKNMATLGNGNFFDTNKMSAGQTLDIESVIKVAQQTSSTCADDANLEKSQAAKAESENSQAPHVAQAGDRAAKSSP